METNHRVDPKWLILISIGIGSFMAALDGSVVNITLPVIGQAFQASVDSLEWIVTIYLLVLSGLQLTFGRLGDLRGNKIVYLSGFIIFVISSALCGLAQNVVTLIIFRTIQAIGGAMISSNSPAILTKAFPAARRGQALGLQATMTYLGLTVGPSLGGFLTNVFGWRSVFYINVPIGALALFLGYTFIRKDQGEVQGERFDLLGAALFLIGLVTLLLGLNQGFAWGWTSLPILALLGGSLIILAAFIYVESRVQDPMLDLSLFRSRVFSLSVLSGVFNYICVYTILFLMPFYLINGRGLDSSTAGLILTAQPIIMAIAAPISGSLSDRFGARWPGMLGMAGLAIGLFLLSLLGPATPYAWVMVALGVAGLGTGTFISPNNSALMGAAPRHRQGIAAGVLATARNVGMVLGVGMSGAIFTTILTTNGSNPTNPLPGPALFMAFQYSFLVVVFVGILGIFTSGVREVKNVKPGN